MGHSVILGSSPNAEPAKATASIRLALATEADTARLAQAWAAEPALLNAYIELQGDLGAGKTTLVRHLLRALGVSGRIKSPTYAVVEPYELDGGPAWHFDFYRFADPREWADAGFRDIFAGPGLKLAEWPERAAPMLPTPDLRVELQLQPDESRVAELHAASACGGALVSAAQRAFA